MKKYVIGLVMLVALLIAVAPASAVPDVCPEGDGWSSHQDPPLEDVGATEYCVKGGHVHDLSGPDCVGGCEGYLEFGTYREVRAVVDNPEACDLSHWSYRLLKPTPTPPPDPTVEFVQGCVDCVPVIGITFTGIEGDTLNITGNGRDLLYEPGVYREKMRPFDSYMWVIYRGDEPVARGKLLVEECPCYEPCDELGEPIISEWSDWRLMPNGDWVRSRTIITPDFYDPEIICDRKAQLETRGPYEVIVDAGFICGKAVNGTVYQLQGGVEVEPAGGATLTLDGVDYTESGPVWRGFGTWNWSAVASPGYTLIGETEGTGTLWKKDCNPEHPPTGPVDSVLPYAILGAGLLSMGASAFVLRRRD
jgi:hypothetical protein